MCIIAIFSTTPNLIEKFFFKDPKIDELALNFKKFLTQPDKIWNGHLSVLNDKIKYNNITINRGNKSYTINKEHIYLCLKDEYNNYYSNNMLYYVLAHEFAHVLCDEIGHTPKFFNIFEELLDEMIKYDLYNPSIPINSDYCLG